MKKNPDGTRAEWVEPHAKDAFEGLQKSIEDWRQTQPASEYGTIVQPSPADMTRIWTTVVGGQRKVKPTGLELTNLRVVLSQCYPTPLLFHKMRKKWKR
ncbi:hypothetical protein P3S67_028993 [Capsicum chacoense]